MQPILADLIPPERRGRAIGAMAGAFSAASVLGIPAGLFLSRHGGWRLPFIVVGALGFLVVIFAARALPPMTGHIADRGRRYPLGALFTRTTVVLSYTMTATVMLAGWSDQRNTFETYRVSTREKDVVIAGEQSVTPAFALVPTEGCWVSSAYRAEDMERFGIDIEN